MMAIVAVLMEHLLLVSVTLAVMVVAALLVRRCVGVDPVLRYRVMVWFLPVLVLALPIQFLVVQTQPAPSPSPASMSGPDMNDAVSAEAIPAEHKGVRPLESKGSDPFTAGPALVEVAVMGVAIYCAGFLVMLLFTMLRLVQARRIVKRSRPVTDPSTLTLWDDVRSEMNVGDRVRLLESESLSTPACWGLGTPAVILPAGVAGERQADRLRLALYHELVHLRRRDAAVTLVQLGCTTVFWFNPFVWLYGRVLTRDRELSCDAHVVRMTGRPRSYAMTLLAFCVGRGQSRRGVHPPPPVPLPGFASFISMQRRLEMIERSQVGSTTARKRLTTTLAAAVITGLAAGHVTLAATHGPGPLLEHAPDDPDARMRAEIHAPREGRSDREVYDKWTGFFRHRNPGMLESMKSPGSFLTDQETMVAAQNARLRDGRLVAKEILVNLPEGSKLKAVFVGERVIFEPGEEETRIAIESGELQVFDNDGVLRVTGRADRDDATLYVTTSLANGEVAFRLTAGSRRGDASVRVHMDTTTGIPEGEEQPPHGAVRYDLLTPDSEDDPYRLKMQWIYDLYKLRGEFGDAVNEGEPGDR